MNLFVRSIACLAIISFLVSCTKEKDIPKPVGVVSELPYELIKLKDLDAFKVSGNAWRVVEGVSMDRQTVHQVDFTEGVGALLFTGGNVPAELSTTFSHEDLDLRLDFMTSKNATALLYFQGRYGVLLNDSWKSDSIQIKGCGTIFRGNEGKTQPVVNAAKAPGLWQHLSVKFKAPRFDASGNKISNAIFSEIVLNGKLIQENVEIQESATNGARELQEKKGPIKIVGQNGPVAFRNIEYKAYGNERIVLKDIHYNVYKGLFKEYDTLQKLSPLRSGSTDSLHWGLGDKRSQIAFEGTLTAPIEGDYLFNLRAGGPAWILIDDKEIVNNNKTRDYTRSFYGTIKLTKGEHHFKIVYANYDESLVVTYAGPQIPFTSLTTPSSARNVSEPNVLEYAVQTTPVLQRGFFIHHGNVNRYAICVGIPGGMNYTYDVSTFNLLSVWRGKFIDVSNMWIERGEPQLAIPLGASLELPGTPSLLELAEAEDAWTDTVEVDNNIYTDRGYRLNKNGFPVFFYSYKGAAVEDSLVPTSDHSGLVRTITLNFKQPGKDFYFLLGNGKLIEALPTGGYTIDDKEYFIESISGIDSKQLKLVKAKNGRYKLLLPISGEAGQSISFNYSITW